MLNGNACNEYNFLPSTTSLNESLSTSSSPTLPVFTAVSNVVSSESVNLGLNTNLILATTLPLLSMKIENDSECFKMIIVINFE